MLAAIAADIKPFSSISLFIFLSTFELTVLCSPLRSASSEPLGAMPNQQSYSMRQLVTFLFLLFLLSCGQTKTNVDKATDTTMERYNTLNSGNHLLPLIDRTKFDTSHSWDFGWTILEPINVAKDKDDEKLLIDRLSHGQKALYFFWYLDAQVTNGGFIQFYYNDYRQYLPAIIEGMQLIGDTEMINLVNKADKEYLTNKEAFSLQQQKGDLEPLYDNLKEFDHYDSIYYKIHDKTMELIERYARQHPSDFVRFD